MYIARFFFTTSSFDSVVVLCPAEFAAAHQIRTVEMYVAFTEVPTSRSTYSCAEPGGNRSRGPGFFHGQMNDEADRQSEGRDIMRLLRKFSIISTWARQPLTKCPDSWPSGRRGTSKPSMTSRRLCTGSSANL